tara:strand:+ start:1049 stop:1651 length:603 start_codon:yes stop_codon:yes gene_type:complete
MQTLNPYLSPIINELKDFLRLHPQTNEHQIIKHLQATKTPPFDTFSLSHSKDLFNAHFLCMHALYHLKKQFEKERKFSLLINSVRVEQILFQDNKVEVDSPQTFLETSNPLEAYYLNPRHYFETQESEINDMLKSFWNKYLAQDQKQEALNILELPMEADSKMIKKQYRRLAQKYHPDKGGCAEKFHQIREAKLILDNSY